MPCVRAVRKVQPRDVHPRVGQLQYLVSLGVPAQRLVAAGFAEFQPLDTAPTEEAYKRNRRIELKLTER